MSCSRAPRWRSAILTALALALVGATQSVDPAAARSSRDGRRDELAQSRPGAPALAVVALAEQRVTIYDIDGHRILQSPVSSGATGYETPAGIYSVVQKNIEHRSNIYEDGNMPFMQRITWTGIALHAGVLPGHAASHGCVRMPHAFAQRLFPMTEIGLRVVIVREDITPRDISHPALFRPNTARREASLTITPPPVRTNVAATDSEPLPPAGSPRLVEALKARAAARSAEAETLAKRANEARLAATRKAAEAAPAAKAVRSAEINLEKAEEQLKTAERGAESATTPEATAQAEQNKAKAAARIEETRAQLEAAKSQAQAKTEAATRAAADAQAAEAAREHATEAAADAKRKTSPVSVFVSRKAQRLYVRNGYQPVFEAPVTIRDADKPIGSFVFTALNYAGDGSEPRWNVVAMYKDPLNVGAAATQDKQEKSGRQRRAETRSAETPATDVTAAGAALDRIVIGREALERISEVVLPGSSLIISDEALSIETGKDTDFVVIMSGEPQGGLKKRQREPSRYRDDYWGGGGGGFFSFWN